MVFSTHLNSLIISPPRLECLSKPVRPWLYPDFVEEGGLEEGGLPFEFWGDSSSNSIGAADEPLLIGGQSPVRCLLAGLPTSRARWRSKGLLPVCLGFGDT